VACGLDPALFPLMGGFPKHEYNQVYTLFLCWKKPKQPNKNPPKEYSPPPLPWKHYIKDHYPCFGTVYPILTGLLVSSKEYPKRKCQEELMLKVLPIGEMQREACLLVWPTLKPLRKERTSCSALLEALHS